MKLILCELCLDVVCLRETERTCFCGESKGKYIDGLNAEIQGACLPLGINNLSLIQAIKERPNDGLGSRFEAFVIPRTCHTIKRKDQ